MGRCRGAAGLEERTIGTEYFSRITKASLETGIDYYCILIKKGHIQSALTGKIRFETVGEQTKVVWSEFGEESYLLPNKWMYLFLGPIKWFALLAGPMLRKDWMGAGLQAVQGIVEKVDESEQESKDPI